MRGCAESGLAHAPAFLASDGRFPGADSKRFPHRAFISISQIRCQGSSKCRLAYEYQAEGEQGGTYARPFTTKEEAEASLNPQTRLPARPFCPRRAPNPKRSRVLDEDLNVLLKKQSIMNQPGALKFCSRSMRYSVVHLFQKEPWWQHGLETKRMMKTVLHSCPRTNLDSKFSVECGLSSSCLPLGIGR
jgi:hypothetical protein